MNYIRTFIGSINSNQQSTDITNDKTTLNKPLSGLSDSELKLYDIRYEKRSCESSAGSVRSTSSIRTSNLVLKKETNDLFASWVQIEESDLDDKEPMHSNVLHSQSVAAEIKGSDASLETKGESEPQKNPFGGLVTHPIAYLTQLTSIATPVTQYNKGLHASTDNHVPDAPPRDESSTGFIFLKRTNSQTIMQKSESPNAASSPFMAPRIHALLAELSNSDKFAGDESTSYWDRIKLVGISYWIPRPKEDGSDEDARYVIHKTCLVLTTDTNDCYSVDHIILKLLGLSLH